MDFKRDLSLLLGNPNVFTCAPLFMKAESRGRDCVHLSVICSTLLMPLCHMSFYLAAHRPPKSLCAYIIFLPSDSDSVTPDCNITQDPWHSIYCRGYVLQYSLGISCRKSWLYCCTSVCSGRWNIPQVNDWWLIKQWKRDLRNFLNCSKTATVSL